MPSAEPPPPPSPTALVVPSTSSAPHIDSIGLLSTSPPPPPPHSSHSSSPPPPLPPPSSSPLLTNGDLSHPLRTLCATLHRDIAAFLASSPKSPQLQDVQIQTRCSLQVIQEALDRYPLSALSLSYNGGKDCLVLLILYLSCLATHPHLPHRLPAIYIPPPYPFPAVDAFVASSADTYHLALARYAHPTMRDAFARYLTDYDSVQAVFVGTRRTDPHGGSLIALQPTDGGWPAFMRVHPVLEWHYVEVWSFLRHFQIPYCELYDQGYTSLGCITDTHPNPALKVEGDDGIVTYRPAYELEEDREERLGRDW